MRLKMTVKKCTYNIIEDNEMFAVVQYATKDSWGTKFYDCSANPHDFLEFIQLKRKLENEDYKDSTTGRIIYNNSELSIIGA
jgi:hypothetical protein